MRGSFKKCGKRKGPFIFLFIVAGIFGLSAIVMLLWNEIMPSLIHASTITYWHAMGLLVLCKILFGGFRPGGRGYRGYAHHQRWKNLSADERQELRDKIRQKWGEGC